MITLLAEPGSLVAGTRLSLGLDEAHHLSVRRAEAGDPLRLVDGHGAVGWASLARAGRHPEAVVERVDQVPVPPGLILGVGAGDKDRFGWMVEKAVETGATAIIPLETERSAAVGPRIRAGSGIRLNRRAREAMKQCGAAWCPTVAEPEALAVFLGRDLPPRRWVADRDGSRPGRLATPEALVIVVGPEGGLTESERGALQQAAFRPVRLSDNILRFETAAVAALALAWHLRGGDSHE